MTPSIRESGATHASVAMTVLGSPEIPSTPTKVTDSESNGCKARRGRKQAAKKDIKEPKKPNARQPKKTTVQKAKEDQPQESKNSCMIERKRRRGRAESDWPTYVEQTRARITSLQTELITVHATGDIKNVQRIKNMISAYESRLGKRAKFEEFQDQLKVREQQLSTVLGILQRELMTEELARVNRCILLETPQLSSLTNSM